MPPGGLTVDRANNPVLMRVSCPPMVFSSVPDWTAKKFSTEYPCHVQLIRLGCVCVRFSPYGLVHDTSRRRGTWPRYCCALVQSRRTAARISHRTVRNRALAALSRRAGISRESPGSQSRGGNLARSGSARGHARQHRPRSLLARTPAMESASQRRSACARSAASTACVRKFRPSRCRTMSRTDVLAALESVLVGSAEAPSVPDAPDLDDLPPPRATST